MTMTHRGVTPFGLMLRQWRTTRGMSQLVLSVAAQTTSRHVSFLETGRSRPTESMVIRLCEALVVPLRDRNRMLEAAGLAPAYVEEAFDEPRYETARAAVEKLLTAHEPYPALLIHKDGNVISANRGATLLFGGDLTGKNMVDWIFASGDPSDRIANWPEIAQASLARMRSDAARSPSDERLQMELEIAEQTAAARGVERPADGQLVACPWVVVDGTIVHTMVIAARFDNALDVTLDELRIELVYPLDDAAEDFFRASENEAS